MPATLRARYGVSWWQAGQPNFPWPEVRALVLDALADPSTSLGAEAAGWEYPARLVDLVQVQALTGDQASKVMPYKNTPATGTERITDDEITRAQAELAESIIISG